MVPYQMRDGCQAPGVTVVVLLLLLTGLVPGGSSIKCYACDGGMSCHEPDANQVKECGAGVHHCFKSGAACSTIRGCAPKHLLDHFGTKAMNGTGSHSSCFDSRGGDPPKIEQIRIRLCQQIGERETYPSPPRVIRIPVIQDWRTCVCTEDLCNEGQSDLMILLGTWNGAQCRKMEFGDLLLSKILNSTLKTSPGSPDRELLMNVFREYCSEGSSPTMVRTLIVEMYNEATEAIGTWARGDGVVGVAIIHCLVLGYGMTRQLVASMMPS